MPITVQVLAALVATFVARPPIAEQNGQVGSVTITITITVEVSRAGKG